MLYNDPVYGKFEITEPVILDLINSPSLKRLEKIEQGGYLAHYNRAETHSRFEHSVGVYLLLKMFGVSLEEQLAGLIHDVSHSVFSHCIDYVLDEGSPAQNSHQDNIFNEFVLSSEIPQILARHKIDTGYILDDTNFPLKEKNIPDLCADRIDYILRHVLIFNLGSLKDAKDLLKNLEVINNQWVFKDSFWARKYADYFFELNRNYYCGLTSALMFQTAGDCLRYAVSQKYISKEDLYTTDDQVLGKLKKFVKKDPQLNLLWRRMNNKIRIFEDKENYDKKVICKSRMVDPLFRSEVGIIKRVSDMDEEFARIVEQELIPKEYYLRFDKCDIQKTKPISKNTLLSDF